MHRADCPEIWEPQIPEALRACPGLITLHVPNDLGHLKALYYQIKLEYATASNV